MLNSDRMDSLNPIFDAIIDIDLKKQLYQMYVELNDRNHALHIANNNIPAVLTQCPAGKGQHHYWEGGLIDHLVEMWDFGQLTFKQMRRKTNADFTLSDVAVVILVHDISKAIAFEYLSNPDDTPVIERRFNYRKGFFENMGFDNTTAWLLTQFDVHITKQQYVAMLHTEGGWSEQAKAKRDGNMLAKFMHILDMYSSQLIGGKFFSPRLFIMIDFI